jgi:CRP-like cAMP-binding protein
MVQQLQDYAKNSKFFSELDPKAQQTCIEHMVYQFCKAGEVRSMQFVFHQFEEGSRFYVVLSGSVAVLKVAHRADGKTDYSQLAVLMAGSCFGELALISNQLRAASILCREPTQLAVLERDEYRRILGRIDDAKLEAKVQLLQKHPAFCSWSKSSLQRISYFFNERTYRRKQVVFKAGVAATFVYLVKSGDFQLLTEMKVNKTGWKAPGSTGQMRLEREVTLVSVGEMMGDSESLSGLPYRLKCVCASAIGEVLLINKDDFLKRVANEQSLDYFRKYITIRETNRSEQISKNSILRGVFSPSYSPPLPEIRRFDESEQLQDARGQLTKALERRWGLPINPTPQPSSPPSPLKASHTLASLPEMKSTSSPSSRGLGSKTWIDLVTRKYSHVRRESEVFLHQLKAPEQNMSPRRSHQSLSYRKSLTLKSSM